MTSCAPARWLALSSLDDAIAPADTLPIAAARANPHVRLETAEAGGHVAFVSGRPVPAGLLGGAPGAGAPRAVAAG